MAALQAAAAQIRERLVGADERIRGGLSPAFATILKSS